MPKTMVYLSDDEAEGLRRVSEETGASPTDLIRRGLRTVLEQPAEAADAPTSDVVTGGNRPRRWTSFGLH